ncbi:MAG: hypothetical protein A2X94_17485 [Bdellovibrionales bacterium GWB1_55_8]|nr:MAG: hypothetical protein A2X94_17485 [Bdellovibrionales bacterium GWB1_55_8]
MVCSRLGGLMRQSQRFAPVLIVGTLLIMGSIMGFQRLAQASGNVHETWTHSDWLTPAEVARWSRSPGIRDYVFRMLNPGTSELAALLQLSAASSLTIEMESLPQPGDADLWRKLARKVPLKIKLLDIPLPATDDIQLLNSIAPHSIEFLMKHFPDIEDGERLSAFTVPISIEFQTPFYPRYEEKELLLAIPANVTLNFVSQIWPWYHQMDVFNMTPHAKKLKILGGTFPSGPHWDYLKNIHGLEEVAVYSDYPPPSPEVWKEFGDNRIVWVYSSGVPVESDLKAFERSSSAPGSRKLIIQTEASLPSEERARLDQVSIPVDWKHPVPWSDAR